MCNYSMCAMHTNIRKIMLLKHALHLFLRFRCLSNSSSIKKTLKKQLSCLFSLRFWLPKIKLNSKFYAYILVMIVIYVMGLDALKSQQQQAFEPQYELPKEQ